MNSIDNVINQLITEQGIPVKSLKIQKDLNDKIWDPNNNYKLNPEIRQKLLSIADFYYQSLKLQDLQLPDIKVVDVIFVGSLANYNWSKYSDIDLHLVSDYSVIDPKYTKLFQEYADLRKKMIAEEHDIKIMGYDVELYIQDLKHTMQSLGVYSVQKDAWVKFPEKHSEKIDINLIKNKSKSIMDAIDIIEKHIDFGNIKDYDMVTTELDLIWKRIKNMRKTGLETGGEFSVENMVFKILRRNGYIGKLLEAMAKVTDEKLSI